MCPIRSVTMKRRAESGFVQDKRGFPLPRQRARNEGVETTCMRSLRPAASSTRWPRAMPSTSRSWTAEAGETVTFDKVLAVLDGDTAKFGAPTVEGATVTANVVKNGKGKKVLVFKYKPKKSYRQPSGPSSALHQGGDHQGERLRRSDMTTITFHSADSRLDGFVVEGPQRLCRGGRATSSAPPSSSRRGPGRVHRQRCARAGGLGEDPAAGRPHRLPVSPAA